MNGRRPGRIDLFRLHAAEYAAGAAPAFVEVGPARFIALDGAGSPDDTPFQGAIAALYAVAFAVKAACRDAGVDWGVGKLEVLWPAPRQWRLMVRIPAAATDARIADARATLAARGRAPDSARVACLALHEGRCVQMLQDGTAQATLAALQDAAARTGLAPAGPRHDIYLSDPRRTQGSRLRTVIRLPVR